MGILTATTSFSSTDGEELDSSSSDLYDTSYDYDFIEITYYISEIDKYLTYQLTGHFNTDGSSWYGSVSKLECLVNYSSYYSLTGSYSYNGWGSNPDIFYQPYLSNDTFVGSEDNDYFLFGNKGTDKFFGNGGNDFISTTSGKKGVANGGDGDDFISSNGVMETITGGDGEDIIRILSTGQKDVINDFTIGEDTLEVSLSSGQSKLTSMFELVESHDYLCAQASQIAVGDGIKKAQDADDVFIYNTDTGYLYFDKDGTGKSKAVQLAIFKNIPEFTAQDIADSFIISLVGGDIYTGASDEYLTKNEYGTI